jgi:hypothetical protein
VSAGSPTPRELGELLDRTRNASAQPGVLRTAHGAHPAIGGTLPGKRAHRLRTGVRDAALLDGQPEALAYNLRRDSRASDGARDPFAAVDRGARCVEASVEQPEHRVNAQHQYARVRERVAFREAPALGECGFGGGAIAELQMRGDACTERAQLDLDLAAFARAAYRLLPISACLSPRSPELQLAGPETQASVRESPFWRAGALFLKRSLRAGA